MKPPKPFGETLEELMRLKGLTAGALGARLGLRAELKRALDGELPSRRRDALYEAIAAQESFSDDELRRLDASREVSDVGVREYLMRATLLRLMGCGAVRGARDSEPNAELSQRLQPLLSADSVRIICINSCYPSLFYTLQPLFATDGRDVEMRHLVRTSRLGCDAATLIYCAHPLLSDPRYQPLDISPDADMQCFSGDFTIIRYTRGGKRYEMFFVMQNNEHFFWLSSTTQLGAFDLALEVIDRIQPAPTKLKELGQPGTGYIDMMLRYLGLELNRTTFSLCADVGSLQVPPQIAASALSQQGLEHLALSDPKAIDSLLKLMQRRHANLYNKRKPDYQVTTLEGMRRFMETGRSRAHFAGFRDFTLAERVAILENLLAQARPGSRYHLHALRERRPLADYTIIGFDKLGVSVVPADATYHTGWGFSYLFVTAPDFIQAFWHSYKSHILTDLCLSEQETTDALSDMLAEYKRKLVDASH